MSRYDPEVFVEAIGRFQITETLLVPPMLLSLPLSVHCQSHALRSLRQVFVGGASIGNHVQQCMYKVLSEDARVNQIYGMTEAGWVCGSQYPEKDETGSIGRPLKGFKLK